MVDQTDRRNGLTTAQAIKPPVRVATTAAITLTGEQTVDGVAIVSGDRVLVKDQVDQTTNGIYIANTSSWTRSKDFDGNLDIVQGTLVYVANGSVNERLIFQVTTVDPIVIGTSALVFTPSLLNISTFVQTLLNSATSNAFLTTLTATRSETGAYAMPVLSWIYDTVITPEQFGAIGDNADHALSTRYASLAAAQAVYPFVTSLTQQIDWAAWQAAVNACAHSFDNLAKPGIRMGAGKKYHIGADPIVPPNYQITIEGQGRQASVINFTGTACFKSPAATYFCPQFRDFSIQGDATTGYGIDLSPTTTDVFNGSFENMDIFSGSECIFAPMSCGLFSFSFEGINGNSYNGHTFRAHCGNTVSWRNCYAASAGSGKAGYRLSGNITMHSCTGVNNADYWGVFGSNTAGTGGSGAFATDFASTSYPDIHLYDCNIEAYAVNGVWAVQQVQDFHFYGGTISRVALATAYHSDVRQSLQALGVSQIGCTFEGTRVFLGAGVPSGAHLYTDSGGVFYENGALWSGAGVTTWFDANVALSYQLMTLIKSGDVFQSIAFRHNALNPRRITAELLRFKELTPATGTTAPDATGYTMVKTANATATSIDRFTWTTTFGIDSDTSRNGFLMLMVEDELTTLTHGTATTGGLRLRDRASYQCRRGDVFLFVMASRDLDGTTRNVWVEVGRTSRSSANAVQIKDDFLGEEIDNTWWQSIVGTDPNSRAAIVNPDQMGGVVRMVTGSDAGGTMALNGVQLYSQLNWQANQDGMVCEFKLKMDAITNVAVYLGFTDQRAALEMPFTLGAGDALTSNCSDGCGVLFDTAADTDTWWLVGVANDVDATKQNSTIAPVAATFETWRLEVTTAGVATFLRNGVVIGVTMAGATRATIPLTPVVATFARAGALRNIDIDSALVEQKRSNT